MAKKVQLMTNAKEWQTVNGVEVLMDVPQEDLDPITNSSCVEIEGHRTLEETISQENMFTPEIVETKVSSKVGGVYHDNVVDGAYEEAILYGNTQVNLVESVTTDTKYIPHSFTSFQGNESKIGNYNSGRTNQVAPLVKGVTMVNLAQTTSSSAKVGSGVWVSNIKPSTKYTLSLTYTIQNSRKGLIIQSYNDTTYLENSKQITGLETNVQLTFITHENANAVRICNAEGYGGETIQLDNIMVIEGDVTDLDLPFFKGMRSVELSRPLTNLFTDDLRTESLLGGTATNSGGTVVATAESIGTWKGMAYFLDNKLKPNTKYLIMWDSLTQTQTSTTNADVIIGAYHHDGGTVTTRLGKINDNSLCPVMRSIVFDTGNYDVTQISIRVHATLSNSETGTTTVKGLRVFEWDDSLRTLDLQTIGYFSGTKYVSAPRTLETEGKNLYSYGDASFTATNTNVDSWYDHKGTAYMHGDIALKSKSRFLLKQGTYTITTGVWVSATACQLIDDKEQIVVKLDSGQRNHVFTLSQDTYCTLRIKASAVNTVTQIPNIQIERGETGTTYEAYQSRYYKPRETEEIILRSLPNGVCDTFNLQTGELVQRVGEIVLDGGEDEGWYEIKMVEKGDYIQNNTEFLNHLRLRYGSMASPNISVVDSKEWENPTKQGIYSGGNLGLTLLTSNFTTLDKEGWCAYLSQNPITVQYELKEPIITKLQTYARVYSGQTNARTNMGNNLSALTYRYSTDYLKVGNLSPVPAILEPITSIPYDVRLKPSTLYTVKYNRGGYSNSMKFDLGGSVVEKTNSITSTTGIAEELTVRTPAILSHEQLILSGTGYAHNFIVVEGDITGTELPYFEGMKDVKMPIVKNIGKNLFDINGAFELGYLGEGNGLVTLSDRSTNFICGNGGFSLTITKSYGGVVTPYIKVKPNTKYVASAEYINVPASQNNFVFYDINKTMIANTTLREVALNRTFTTPSSCEYIRIGFWLFNPGIICYENIQLEECLDSSLSTPYQQHKENSIYAVQGEYPITSEMIEQGGFTTANGKNTTYETMKYEASIRLRSKELIPVKPNTTYAFAHSFSKFAYNVYQWNGNREFMDGTSQYFADGQVETITTTADTQYIHFLMSKHDASQAITVAEYDWSLFHMYELDSTINLRSLPNGVKDELNLLTGEYIQRVGEVVLDNAETWNMDTTEDATQPNTNIFYTGVHSDFKPLGTVDRAGSLVCDKVNVVPDLYFVDKVGIMSNTDPRIYVRVLKTDAPDVATFTTYIKNNPLTLQYTLAEPIISHVRLVSNNQEREVGVKLPNGVCNTYNPSTGITTVRVGIAEFDGSADEGWRAAQTDPNRFVCEVLTDRKYYPYDTVKDCMLCDKITVVSYKELYGTNGTDGVYGIAPYNGNTNIQIRLKDITTAEQLQQYLSQNPITVWYELKYPQIQPDIVLPNGVHDEYNPETGVYTKKVGFAEFDGSEDEGWTKYSAVNTGGLQYFRTPCPLMRVSDNQAECKYVLSDSITVVPYSDLYNGLVTLDKAMSGVRSNSLNKPCIYIYNSEISDESIFKTSLSQNPIKVWYEFATPITYQLTPYFGLPQPYAYEDGYLIHDSAYAEATLPPEFKYKLVANRTGQVMQNNRKLQEHTTRLSNLEALIIEATIESLFNRELQLFELELMDIQLIDLGE